MKATGSEAKRPEPESLLEAAPGSGPDPTSTPTPEYVTLARIQTTHGRHGEVAADLLTDFPERLDRGLEVLVGVGGKKRWLRIEDAWLHRGKHPERLILKFEGIDTLTEAEKLSGSTIQLPLAERHALPEGRLYVSDLIGCAVIERGSVLGTVAAWDETGGAPLLRVAGRATDARENELLIPYVPDICYAVDTAKREIHVRLPEGLQELNVEPRRKKGGE